MESHKNHVPNHQSDMNVFTCKLARNLEIPTMRNWVAMAPFLVSGIHWAETVPRVPHGGTQLRRLQGVETQHMCKYRFLAPCASFQHVKKIATFVNEFLVYDM